MKWREILKAPLIPRTKRRKKENQITFQATDQYLIMDIWKNKVNICRHAVDRKTWEYGTYYVGTGKKEQTNLTNCTEGFGGCYWGSEPCEGDWLEKEQAKELEKFVPMHDYSWISDPLRRI